MGRMLHLHRVFMIVITTLVLSLPAVEALAESGAASPAEQYRSLSRSGEESTLERILPAPKKETDCSRQEGEQARLAWEHWFFDLRSAIQKEVEARCMAASIRRSPDLVTSATFVVSKEGQVTRLELVQQSAKNAFDLIVTDSITAMKDSQLLKFPEGANREFIDVSTTHAYMKPRVIICRAPESEWGGVCAIPYAGTGSSEKDWDNWKSQVREVLAMYFEFTSERRGFTSNQLRAVAKFRVIDGRKLTNVNLIKASSNQRFNSLVLECIRMLDGNMQLNFPPGSTRRFCDMSVTFDSQK